MSDCIREIPFSPPYIDQEVIDEVTAVLKSGWITTGPRVAALEKLATEVTGSAHVLAVNSWTSGAALVWKWWGLGPGDEVIIPAYTYAATALSVLHTGARPVMVDILDDFTLDPEGLRAAISPRTRAVVGVDIGGLPAQHEALLSVIEEARDRIGFEGNNLIQKSLGRPLLLADAAHSLGARYGERPSALMADISIFSLHASKNVSSAEGGLIALQLPEPLDNAQTWSWMKIHSMNGQTRNALEKTREGNWRYDIISDGLKVNLPDLCAAVALAQLRQYASRLLPRRREIYQRYTRCFEGQSWARIQPGQSGPRQSSHHLLMLQILDFNESQRDQLIQKMGEQGVATNVHFVPLPKLTLFRNLGYVLEDFPMAYSCYSREISLPLYPQLLDDQVEYIASLVLRFHEEIKG